MALKPETSLTVGLATAAVVYGTYTVAMPSVADLRVADSDNPDAATAEKAAAWFSAAVVGGISLIAKDATVFILGGTMIVALSWWYKHSNAVDPQFHSVVPRTSETPEVMDESPTAAVEDFANAGYGSF